MEICFKRFRSERKIKLIKKIIRKVVACSFSLKNKSSLDKIIVHTLHKDAVVSSFGGSIIGAAKLTTIRLDKKYNIAHIYINSSLSNSQVLSVLAHEICHVKQMLDKKLTIVKSSARWKHNNKYNVYNITKQTYEQYMDSPWEIEAEAFATSFKKQWKQKLIN